METKEFSFYIAGFKYHDGPSIIKCLDEGDELFLIPEPNNPHDPNAIRIYTYIDCQDFMLGYVPKNIAKDIDVKKVTKAFISHVDPSAEPWLMVRVYVIF
jgi:hypothetical protein